MLSIRHCIYYQCLMNGNNGPGEGAARSMFYCPVCLRKAAASMARAGGDEGVDLRQRFVNMREGWESVLSSLSGSGRGVRNDIKWLQDRVNFMDGTCGHCDAVDYIGSSDEEGEGGEEEEGSGGIGGGAPALVKTLEELASLVQGTMSYPPFPPSGSGAEFASALSSQVTVVPASGRSFKVSRGLLGCHVHGAEGGASQESVAWLMNAAKLGRGEVKKAAVEAVASLPRTFVPPGLIF